jgi:hypothetical protein
MCVVLRLCVDGCEDGCVWTAVMMAVCVDGCERLAVCECV